MRAALYARFSKDDQNPLSTADQLTLCRRYAAQIGAHVVREFSDEAISGFSTGNRPGMQGLMAAARAGEVDVVIAEHTDRMSRGLSGSGAVYEDLKSFGVRYLTVNQGVVTLATAGLSGLVSAMTIEEGANKTRRGLRSRVEAGRSGGGLTYGYRVKIALDERGERVRGLLEIDPAQAGVVTRIFRDYAAGVSPLAIAAALNGEDVAGPRGGPWNHSTIAGNARRGVGILHNELYRGVRVWGRRTFVKDRVAGTRRGLDATAEPVREKVPELAIVAPDLWDAVRARHALLSRTQAGGGARPGNGKRPKRFLQGLIVCGLCGGPMTRAGPKEALRCATRAYRKACANTSAPGYPGIEARVVAAIKGNLLHPEVIEHAIAAMRETAKARRKDDGRRRAKASAELGEVKRRADRLLDQVADGLLTGAAVKDKLAGLEARRAELERSLAAAPEAEGVVDLHPAAAARYRRHIERLIAALDAPEDTDGREDRAVIRELISEIRFTPLPGHGRYALEIAGDLAPILQLGQDAKTPAASATGVMREVGAGTRIVRRHSLPFTQAA